VKYSHDNRDPSQYSKLKTGGELIQSEDSRSIKNKLASQAQENFKQDQDDIEKQRLDKDATLPVSAVLKYNQTETFLFIF
jgi:hypothetical protein